MAKTIFETDKKETLQSKIKRLGFNFFPAYRRTGARICFISGDFQEVHVRLGLNWKTKNYVGSVFGGSIYGALDPVYMVQLINLLGRDYIVWDMSAKINFIRPVKKTVYARFLIRDELLDRIKKKVKSNKKYIFDLTACFQDREGAVYAEVSKTMYIAERMHYKTQKVK